MTTIKQFTLFFLTLCLISLPAVSVSAADTFEPSSVTTQVATVQSASKSSSADPYKKYATDEYYSKLSADEKCFYDMLNNICLTFLLYKEDGTFFEELDCYTLPECVTASISSEDAKRICNIFRLSNPQYYYLSGQDICWTENDVLYYAPGIYSSFSDGIKRTAYTKKFFTKVDSLVSQIQKKCRKYSVKKKAAYIHDLLIRKYDYDYTAEKYINAGNTQKLDRLCTQSAWPLIMRGKGVCASYSAVYQLLCDATHIPAITITSAAHEWNKIQINGKWYNVDLTFDEAQSVEVFGIYSREWFLKSSRQYSISDSSSSTPDAHKLESIWDGLVIP